MSKKLMQEFTFPNGKTLNNRIFMPPMVTKGANDDYSVSEDNLAYYGLRSEVGGLVIAESMYINEQGIGFANQMSLSDGKYLDGLKKLTTKIKKNGAKVVVQLYHGGREAVESQHIKGETVVPSAIEFPFLDYQPRELTAEEIDQTIKDYGKATKLAIDSGFDGVEIHGANHYLIQQFFSAYSNRRMDKWGGSLEKRMAFPLAVVKEVLSVKEQYGSDDFIIGYRITPEEVHEDNVGYTYQEAVELVKEITKHNVDYIHASLFTKYNASPADNDKTYTQLIKEVMPEEIPLLAVGGIFTEDDADDALNYMDLVGIGRAALIEPKFAKKIAEGKGDTINRSVSPENLETLKWPKGLYEWVVDPNAALLPVPGEDTL